MTEAQMTIMILLWTGCLLVLLNLAGNIHDGLQQAKEEKAKRQEQKASLKADKQWRKARVQAATEKLRGLKMPPCTCGCPNWVVLGTFFLVKAKERRERRWLTDAAGEPLLLTQCRKCNFIQLFGWFDADGVALGDSPNDIAESPEKPEKPERHLKLVEGGRCDPA